MTEQDTTTAPAGAQIDADEQTVPGQGNDTPQAVREARDRYRGERDAARDELAAAQTYIEKLQRVEVDRLAADLSQPSDLMELGGVTLADLLDAAGDVDSAAVAQAVAALIESRPGLAKNPRQRAVDMSQGSGSLPSAGKPSFNDLFQR